MDRLTSEGYKTDKGPNYLVFYESFFAPHRSRSLNVLELGIHLGGSLEMWRDYFRYGQIFGVDVRPVSLSNSTRIHTFIGDARDPALFEQIESETDVAAFDIIIDDASHIARDAHAAFEHLFVNRLSPGGIYVVEDWGTGYRKDWPDGAAFDQAQDRRDRHWPSHDAGMVGFVKTLVDHVAHADVMAGGGQITPFPIEFMTFAPGLVFMKKSP